MILETPELKSLLENQDDHSVSIYMPTWPAGKESEQGPIRFRNLISRAEKQLHDYGTPESVVNEMIKPAHRLAGDREFWVHQSLGLAAFISPNVFRYHRLPMQFDESLIINSRFSLKQLLRLFNDEGRYFILWLSKGGVRFFQASRFGLAELELTDIPHDMDEALMPVEAREAGSHGPHARHNASESHPGIAHGHGSVLDIDKIDAMKFFRRLDNGLHRLLRNENAPLMLCGVEYLHSLYRDANTYPYLMDEGVMVNPRNQDELHRLSLEVAQPLFQSERKKAFDLFFQNLNTGLASSDINSIIPAADDGRVRYLFVETGARLWGKYDASTHEVSLRVERWHGDEDLLDFASIRTLLNSGTVYSMDRDRMPDGSQLSAVYRY